MRTARRFRGILPLVLLPLLACSGSGGTGRVDAGGALERGDQRVSDLTALSRRSPVVEGPEAIELLYLERLRLGLGSPFRLIEQALVDERLEPERRRRLGEALLSMTYEGRTYVIDATGIVGPRVVVDDVGPQHLRLISDAVAEASDPRIGEEAVRLAYLLAQAEGVVDPVLVRGVGHAASLIRDRVSSRRDAHALIRAAYESGRDPLDLVREWRAARRLEVEAPRLRGLDHASEQVAIRLAPRLTEAIRVIGSRGGARADLRRAPPASLLNAATASALFRTLEPMPAQAPVGVAVGIAGRMFAGSFGVEPDTLAADLRRRMPDEERLALQQVILLEHQPELRPVLARATLAAASGLRAYSQETVWQPGTAAPSTRELIAQFGFEDIVFAESIPGAWRPYYRRMIHSAMLDLQRVLPALDVRGLRLVVGPVPSGGALALHSPGLRTIFLPPETGAGTIAHEIAHDLDWQVARKRYRVRGDYGSDIASRGGRNDRLAATYVGLTGAALVDNAGASIDRPHHTRPAEIFARSIDWLVAATLARDGRMNGYLTSIQDELLTGYGTAVPPDANGRVGAALVNILDEVAPMRAETRSWYLDAYGLGRELSPTDLVRLIAEVPIGDAAPPADGEAGPPAPTVSGSGVLLAEPMRRLRETAAAAVAVGVCRPPANPLDPSGAGARTRLIEAAARARARGLAREYAARVLGRRAEEALVERFEQGPWATPVDPAHAGVLRALIEATEQAVQPEAMKEGGWFGEVAGPRC